MNEIPKPNWVFPARVIQVTDGDTIVCHVDHGFEPILSVRTFRLKGINTPEVRGEEGPWGRLARDHLAQLIAACGNEVVLQSFKPDKYGGRWLATIWPKGGSVSLNDQMLLDKFAVAYFGEKKLPYPVETLPIQPDGRT